MKFKVYIYLLVFVSQSLFSQGRTGISSAEKSYEEHSYVKAIDITKRIAEKGLGTIEVYQKLGDYYYFKSDYINASKWYEKIATLNDASIPADFYFRYSKTLKALKLKRKSNEMLALFNLKCGQEAKQKTVYKSSRNSFEEIDLQSDRYDIKIFPLSSKYTDFAPTFMKRRLVFSSARENEKCISGGDESCLDLYVTDISPNEYSTISRFSDKINSEFHESTSVFTKDGNTVYFSRNFISKKLNSGSKTYNKYKIYRSKKIRGMWSTPVELPFNNNAFSCAHPALSPDEKKLYFASDRPGTYGGSDLYVVNIYADGRYSRPKNLGPHINTKGRETFPFVSSNGDFYFATNGRKTLGGLDIFVTKLEKDKNNKIYNLGRPVNSEEDDFSFIIDDVTKKGFFASRRMAGKGRDDIFMITEKNRVRETCQKRIRGSILDKKKLVPVTSARVSLINDSGEVVKSLRSNSQGRFSFSIDCSQNYFVRVEKKQILTSEKFIQALNDESDMNLVLEVEPSNVIVSRGDDLMKKLNLTPIYFDLDEAIIRDDAKVTLESIIAILENHKSIKIDVRSHTDSSGNDNHNMDLSQKRVNATIKYLIANGVSASRVTGSGYGETQLVNRCANTVKCTKAEHAQNRRSEFIIVDN